MKQKVVIKLTLNGSDQKLRTKAFKIAVSQPGVESAAITGEEKNKLEVVGEIDAAALTSLLRKKNFGQAELMSVGPAGGSGDQKDGKGSSDAKPQTAQPQLPFYYYYTQFPQYPVYPVRDSYDQQGCSIM